MLSWMSRDGKLILLSRITRGVGYGFLSVVLAIYLRLLGLNDSAIGIVLTSTLASSACFTILAGALERKIGRKRTLLVLAALMSLAGSIFFLTTSYLALLLAALVGTINVTGTEVGPFLSVEQAVIPQTCDTSRRTLAFAWYGLGGTLATSAGALLGGVPPALQAAGLGLLDSFRPIFGLYVLTGLTTLLLYLFLSKDVERTPAPSSAPAQDFLSPQSRRRVAGLSALFAMDAFGGGFVLQSVVSYWFYVRFGASLAQISLVFFGAGVLTAFSFLAAERVSRRIGLVSTMVLTHLPSNLLLVMVPLAPSFQAALGLYLARMSISQMDVPTRQSYVVAIVDPDERVAAAGLTNVSRNVAQSVSPSLSGYLLQFVSLSAPFFVGGGLKIAYDLLLYTSFSKVGEGPPSREPPDETA